MKNYTINEIWNILINYIEHNKRFNEIEYINSIIAIEDLLNDLKKEYNIKD